MNQISDKDIEQFHALGYFVTGVVFTEDELSPVREEFDRVYAEPVAAAGQRILRGPAVDQVSCSGRIMGEAGTVLEAPMTHRGRIGG